MFIVMRPMRVRVLGCLLMGSLALGAPRVGMAAEPRHAAAEMGLGVAAVAVTFIYGPCKVIYAVLGSATGGLAWLLTGGDHDTARKIIQPSVRGDYVVTPAHLTMESTLVFSGEDPYR
jgi:hypothetical protein